MGQTQSHPFPVGVDWEMVQRQDLGDGMELEHQEEVKMPVRGHVKNLIRLFSNGLVTGESHQLLSQTDLFGGHDRGKF